MSLLYFVPFYLFSTCFSDRVVNLAEPRAVHLALSAPGSLVVSWFTNGSTPTSSVQFGKISGNLTETAAGTSRSYHESSGWTHDVKLTGLQPATTYYYRVGDSSVGFSDEYHFVTSRNADEAQPQTIGARVVMYGDMGTTANAQATAKVLAAPALLDATDFIFHVGDISYADDVPSPMYESTWEAFFSIMQPIMRYVPYMVCPGNHEHASNLPRLAWSEFFKVFNFRFSMPSRPSSTNSSMWFSFDYGGVHFVSISTETDFEGSQYRVHFGDQLAWLKADLSAASANRKRVPWIVAVGHRPLYTSSKSAYDVLFLGPVRNFVEDLFHEHQVDLYVCGHVHDYERSFPVYKSEKLSDDYVNPTGLVHVVAGAAGCPEGLQPLEHKETWSAYQNAKDYGYGVLEVANSSALTWKYFRVADGGLDDTFTIVRT